MTTTIAGTLPPGVYTVGWRVVAPDGHPVTGDYRFTVKAPAGGESATPPQASPATSQAASPAASTAKPASGAGWWWVGLGVAVLSAVAGAFALVRRRQG